MIIALVRCHVSTDQTGFTTRCAWITESSADSFRRALLSSRLRVAWGASWSGNKLWTRRSNYPLARDVTHPAEANPLTTDSHAVNLHNIPTTDHFCSFVFQLNIQGEFQSVLLVVMSKRNPVSSLSCPTLTGFQVSSILLSADATSSPSMSFKLVALNVRTLS